MIKLEVADAASAALGVLGGIILWAITGAALLTAGLGSYTVNTALPVALALAAVAGPVILARTRSRAPHHFRRRLGILFGALGFLVYASITVVLVVPDTIVFLALEVAFSG